MTPGRGASPHPCITRSPEAARPASASRPGSRSTKLHRGSVSAELSAKRPLRGALRARRSRPAPRGATFPARPLLLCNEGAALSSAGSSVPAATRRQAQRPAPRGSEAPRVPPAGARRPCSRGGLRPRRRPCTPGPCLLAPARLPQTISSRGPPRPLARSAPGTAAPLRKLLNPPSPNSPAPWCTAWAKLSSWLPTPVCLSVSIGW